MQAIWIVWILNPAFFKQSLPKYLSMISEISVSPLAIFPISLYANEAFMAGYAPIPLWATCYPFPRHLCPRSLFSLRGVPSNPPCYPSNDPNDGGLARRQMPCLDLHPRVTHHGLHQRWDLQRALHRMNDMGLAHRTQKNHKPCQGMAQKPLPPPVIGP